MYFPSNPYPDSTISFTFNKSATLVILKGSWLVPVPVSFSMPGIAVTSTLAVLLIRSAVSSPKVLDTAQ